MTDRNEMIVATKETAVKHKKIPVITRYMGNIEANTDKLREQILNGTWTPPPHEEVWITDGTNGKPRNIIKPRWDNEQIVHHMLMRQFEPIVMKRLYFYSAGSVKGKGLHFIAKSIMTWVRGYGKKRFYVAELDIRKFYDNIDLGILKDKLSHTIHDKKYLDLLFKVIGDEKKGIPKGFYTSPLLSHFYLLDFDNYVVQDLHPDHYARYVDNMWLFSTKKRTLHKYVRLINWYLGKYLRLEIKDNWQIFRFDDGEGRGRFINCLGYNIFRNKVRIRKSILKRTRRTAMHVKGRYYFRVCASILSSMGWFKIADAYEYYLRWIKPYVNIGYCKLKVRRYTRRMVQNARVA